MSFRFFLFYLTVIVGCGLLRGEVNISEKTNKCKRNDTAVEEGGRLCGAPCTKKQTCRSPARICRCDGICGRTCVLKDLRCPPLNAPPNGQVRMRDDGEPFAFGSEVIFTCEPDFELRGSARRYCQGDGTWTGEPVSCQLPLLCHRSDLPRTIGVLYQRQLERTFVSDKKVYFICSNQYSLDPPVKRGELICKDGQWLQSLQTCQPKGCLPYRPPEHSQISGPVINSQDGDIIRVTCNNGFALIGSEHIQCVLGSWQTPIGRPHCHDIEYEDEHPLATDYPDLLTSTIPIVTEDTLIASTTELPIEDDDGTIVAEVKWTVEDGDAAIMTTPNVSNINMIITVNSNLRLNCKWPLRINQPSWIYPQPRDVDSYTEEWDKRERILTLTVWSVKEDDTGHYTCISPLSKSRYTLFIKVYSPTYPGQILSELPQSEWTSGEDEEEEEETQQIDVCKFQRPINVVAVYMGHFVQNNVKLPHGATISLRCNDPGIFFFEGAINHTCTYGTWSPPIEVSCRRLKRNSEILPPPIIISSQHEVLYDGSVIVTPGTQLTLDCLWVLPPEPQDTWYHPTWYRSSKNGNLVLDAEIIQIPRQDGKGEYYSYRITVTGVETEYVTYTCLTPVETSHLIRVKYSAFCKLEDADIPSAVKLSRESLKMIYLNGEFIQFDGCRDSRRLVGISFIRCINHHQWSKPKVRCS